MKIRFERTFSIMFVMFCYMITSIGCVSALEANEDLSVDLDNIPVYTVSENGEMVLDNSVDASVLYQMLDDSSLIEPYEVPGPDGDSSIRITPVKNSTINGAQSISNVITVLGNIVWGMYSGSLINVITKGAVSQSVWTDTVGGVIIDRVAAMTTSGIKNGYSSSYMYKSWSSYYKCWIVYYSDAVYSDSARTKLKYFINIECDRDYPIGLK